MEASYIAGLIDGEGSILLYRRGAGASMRVTVSNTFKPVLDWLIEVTGCGCIITKPGNAKHKQGYQWACNSQAGASLLEQIRPYLRIKMAQADHALEFQRRLKIPAEKARKEWQEDYRQRMRSMNRRGPAA